MVIPVARLCAITLLKWTFWCEDVGWFVASGWGHCYVHHNAPPGFVAVDEFLDQLGDCQFGNSLLLEMERKSVHNVANSRLIRVVVGVVAGVELRMCQCAEKRGAVLHAGISVFLERDH